MKIIGSGIYNLDIILRYIFLKTSGFAAPSTMLKRFSVVFLAVLSVLLVSCQLSPKSYYKEIEDAVRVQLAIANALTVYEDGDDALGLYEWMQHVTDDLSARQGLYRDLLAQKAESDPFCGKILQLYDEMDVVLSELQPTQNEHVWTFEELNTNVRFTFELIPTQNGEVYYRCKADADDLRQLMLESLQSVFWQSLGEILSE